MCKNGIVLAIIIQSMDVPPCSESVEDFQSDVKIYVFLFYAIAFLYLQVRIMLHPQPVPGEVSYSGGILMLQ
jgi:hypothetical protein